MIETAGWLVALEFERDEGIVAQVRADMSRATPAGRQRSASSAPTRSPSTVIADGSSGSDLDIVSRNQS